MFCQDLLQKQSETALALETSEHLQRVQASQGSRQMVQISVMRAVTLPPRKEWNPQNTLNFHHSKVNSILGLFI